MSGQLDFRMPATGEGWRHYKGGLYTIVGCSRDDGGFVHVIYTDAYWSLGQFPPLYNQLLGRFLQEIENGKPRFQYERPSGYDPECRYVVLPVT